MDYTEIDKFLNHREKRVLHQEQLLRNTSGGVTLATVRVNYPGIEKSNYITDSIARIVCEDIFLFHNKNIIYKEVYKNREGIIGHFIFNTDNIEVKRKLIYMEENHILGRCVDIDVYYLEDSDPMMPALHGVSRRDIGLEPRKCFLCEEEAILCSRIQKHNIEEIKEYFVKKYEEYMCYVDRRDKLSFDISQLALKAMITEVSTMPSFGLVSPITKGSHIDMDYYTFLDSSFAIVPFIKEMVEVGYSYERPKNIFIAIRAIGIKCEEAMFNVTKGVNTHKGMIFLIGVVATALGKVLYEKSSYNKIETILKDMCENILDDFKDLHKKKELTHGETLYLKHGFAGIRGEVKKGLENIFQEIIPNYQNSKLKGNDLYSQTLLMLMSKVEDSTIVHRQNIEKLREVQRHAYEILNLGGFNSEEGIKAAYDFEKQCIDENVSPGGAADLLALVIFLTDSKKFFS
ncbi:triphosphoribosyl-dephospho-CoA synthase CitG [Clostridium sp.]|uniref:triphosphoribosyl-dephospho-CoA synthase CitG n=1 Tax=Clostridium sp. TaxID=1506 RepID=UPI003463C562